MTNNIDRHLPSPIDNFVESISLPIIQPLLDGGSTTPMTHSTRATDLSLHVNPTPNSSKRQSSRLAQKAASNSGKDAIQIVQELLVNSWGICRVQIINNRILMSSIFMHSTVTDPSTNPRDGGHQGFH